MTMTPLDAVAFAARLALLQAGGDQTGVATLARAWVRAEIGAAAGPELVEPLVERVLGMAHSLIDTFDSQRPGLLGTILAAHERQLIDQLGDDDE
jgi:hypothetical protein